MIKVILNEDLLGCPLFRRLMPRKRDVWLVEFGFPLGIIAVSLGVIALFRHFGDRIELPRLAAMIVVAFLLGLVLVILWVMQSAHVRQEYRKRAERLAAIPEHDFWALESELSTAELQYGTFYFLKDYLYAPHERLLLRYADIATWRFGDHYNAISGTLKDQYIILTEADGFETQLLVRKRAALVQDHEKVRLKLEFYIKKAKYPKGSPYANTNQGGYTP